MYLTSNIPYFKCWVRKEFTNGHQNYHGEYIHGLAVAVTTIPDRCLSFQIVFTGCEADDGSQENVHGGAMWARMPITALVGDISLWSNGLSVCKRIWRNLGTAIRTTILLLNYNGVCRHRGSAKSAESFTPVGIYSPLTMLKAMFRKTRRNTSKVMF
jgi:hypothetical protein